MKAAYLFSLLFLSGSLFAANAQPTSDSLPTYMHDLEELGYCVIPELFSRAETEQLFQRVWHEYIEKAWPKCKLEDRSNWKEEFPIHSKYGMLTGPAGHIQVMWDIRQDPRIVDVFAKIWNTHDLVVSMDGLSLMCPPEIRDGRFDPWPHVDQPRIEYVSESSLKTQPHTIQGQFLFEDSFEGDGGFYCIPKSHLQYDVFAPQLKEEPNVVSWRYNNQFLLDFFRQAKDESGKAHCLKHITAPRGSLILWDSRTVHWNQYPSEDRPHQENSRMRMVGFLLYLPKTRLSDYARELRRESFEKGISSTGAIPTSRADLKHTKDQILPEFEHYLEDPSYVRPLVHLTELGESLLGYDREP